MTNPEINRSRCDSTPPPPSNPTGRDEGAEITDETLVRRAMEDPEGESGKEAASALFARYQRRVYLWCFRMVRSHEKALDLAQDVLLSAYRSLESFQGKARFSSWIFAVARNRCLTALKPVGLLRDEAADLDRLAAPEEGPDIIAEGEEERQMLLELVRKELEPLQQEVLWLRCFERMPLEEITRMKNITASSGARGVLQTARRRLRAALERRRSDERQE